MSLTSCRRFINRAKRENIKIKINQDYEKFIEVNSSFRKKKGLNPSEKIETMKRYGTLFSAEIDGEFLSGVFYLEDKNNIRGWFGASKRFETDKEKQKLIGDANRLIHWEAIKYSKTKKIKQFDWGGYYTGKIRDEQRERINNFKTSFGGKIITQYIYQKDYSNIYKIAMKLYKLKEEVLNKL